MPFFAAQRAIGSVTCGSVIEKRTTEGDLVVIIDDAAFMITMGVFAWVATAATAKAFGERPNPARKSILSFVTRSWATRFATSGAGPVVSRSRISMFLPATVSPCAFR